jgi:hypothetical protein
MARAIGPVNEAQNVATSKPPIPDCEEIATQQHRGHGGRTSEVGGRRAEVGGRVAKGIAELGSQTQGCPAPLEPLNNGRGEPERPEQHQ